MKAKFKIGDKVIVLFHKQYGEVIEVHLNDEWFLPVVTYKVKVEKGFCTLPEHYVVADKRVAE